jgi:hypothetical protein
MQFPSLVPARTGKPFESHDLAAPRFGFRIALIVITSTRGRPVKNLLQDLRFALRQMRRSPGFALTAVLTLALGIAANVIVLGVLQAPWCCGPWMCLIPTG